MKRILLTCLVIIGLGASVVALQPPDMAFAQATNAKNEICQGIGAAAGGGGCNAKAGPSLNTIAKTIVNILSVIIGIVAVIMIMVAGFKYIASGGDSGSVSSAKSTLVYAIVGLIIVAFAQFIVQFVLDKVALAPQPKNYTIAVRGD